MFKKKQKKVEKIPTLAPGIRVDTEFDSLHIKQPKTRISLQQRFDNTEVVSPTSARIRLKCKDLQKLFLALKNLLQQELDHLLIGEPIVQTYEKIKQSQLFRIRDKNKDEINEQLSRVIQACQLLYSKLYNNEKVKDILFVKEEQDLLLFFKHLFGKPYTVCNLPNFRKVLNTIWQHQIFETFDPEKMVDHLRQWSAGIQFPLNPAAIPLHRLVFTNPQQIKKYALLLCNNVTYCNIDGGDCMGLTPFLVAIHANKTNAYEQIIKSGANLFKCPLTFIKNKKAVSASKKGNKQTVQIVQPLTQRKQYNAFEILLVHKQFQQIVNILSHNQVYKLKKMKKSNTQISKRLQQIPDCYLQIHWKTYKGFLSFKQLPKDIITVYKKGGSLRIDYHVEDIQQTNTKPGHFSILIRTGIQEGQSKLQYYFIDHNAKRIHNLMREIHSQKLRLRYQQLSQFGNVEQQYISYIKSSIKTGEQPQSMDLSAQFCYQNVSKAPIYSFKDLQTYERTLFDSDIIDYSILQKSQTNCSIKQNIGNIPKVKSKNIKSTSNFKIDWVKQKINLNHIAYIFALIDKKSPLFLKIQSVFLTLLNQQAYGGKYNSKLPLKMIVDLGSQFSLQVQIKNLTYMSIDNAVFGLQFRTKTMQYQQQQVGLQSLQQTMIMQQNYTINLSRFLGKTERMSDLQQQQANRKFEQILSRQIVGNCSQQEVGNEKSKNIVDFDKMLLDDDDDYQYSQK